MGAEIDRLEVQVEAQATKANNQLDKLAMKLDRVSKALSGLNSHGLSGLSDSVSKFAQASAQLSNVKTADFTRLTKNIEKLSSLNTQQIYGTSSAMHTLATAMNSLGNSSKNSTQVTQLAVAISQLGSTNAQKAAANLPALATAMNSFMTTMAKAQQVSNNVINMTNALAKLASQGAKVGTAGNSLTNSLNRIGISMEKTTKKTRSFSSVIGSIYQKYFWVMHAGNKLWDSVKESMNYVEVLNYFDSAFGQVAESALSQWEEAGKGSAEVYYNSFSDRAKQLTTKMTGFTITESGMLQSTGGKSLGINPSQLMNYQAMFAQMSNSMGVTAETSLKLSTALTEIGADLASVKNMNFDKVWTDMASGLAGMSRTLDKYGVNIRNVNLQQKLTELGINANITALNQNEKALLRTIILLDSTRYAWGDLSETIDQPANQLRLLEANFANLARTIGNIFLPIVAKVLPYLNAVVIALQRLAEWIVKLLGFEDFDWGGSGGIGGAEFDDLIGGIGDTEDSLNSASEAAKKLKTHLLGIDELNVVNNDESSSSGSIIGGLGGSAGLLESALDKILEEYQKAWDEAFANMEDRLDDFADKVAEAYKKGGLFGVGELFSKMLTDALNSIPWESIYESARKFGTGLAQFLNGLITPELFGAVGKTIAGALNTAIYTALAFGEEFDFYDFGVSIATGINKFFETFDFGSLAKTLNVWVDGLKGTIRGFLDTLTWEKILAGANDFLGTLELDTVAVLIGAFTLKNTADNLVKLLTNAISTKLAFATNPINIPTLIISFSKLVINSPGMLGELYIWFEQNILKGSIFDTSTWTGVAKKISDTINSVIDIVCQGIGDALVYIFEETFNWDSTMELLESAKEKLTSAFNSEWIEGEGIFTNDIGKNLVLGIGEGILGAVGFIVEPIGDFFSGLWKAVCEVFGINSPAKEMKPLGEYILLGIVEGFIDKESEFSTAIQAWFEESVLPWFSIEKWSELGNGILAGLQLKWDEIVVWWQESAIYVWWTENVSPWFTVEKWSELLENVKTSFKTKWDETANQWKTNIKKWWDEHVQPWFTKERWLKLGENLKNGIFEGFKGVANKVVDVLNDVISALEGLVNRAINGINSLLSTLGASKLAEFVGFDGSIDNISFGRIPHFSSGGFPEDGLFYANHTELIGQFSNGRTAVANNEMIITGIEEAAYKGFSRAYAENDREVSLLKELLDAVREGKTISIDGRELVSVYDERKARNGFSFT